MLLTHSTLHIFIHGQIFPNKYIIKYPLNGIPHLQMHVQLHNLNLNQAISCVVTEEVDGAVPVMSPGPCRAPAGQRQMCSSKVLPASLSAEALISVSLP